MKKFVLILTVLVSGAVNAADLELNQFSGSLKEVVLVQPCDDGDCNTVTQALSEVQVAQVESFSSGGLLSLALNPTSSTKWKQGATVLDVAAVRVTLSLPKNIPSFGASTNGQIAVVVKDGEGRGVSTREYSASCSISGNQKQVSCTSEGFGTPSHFLTISLSR